MKNSASPRLRVKFTLALTLLTLPLHAQVPPTDSRLTDIPHTDTHFQPRFYRTLAEWQEHRDHLRKQILSASGLLPMPAKSPLHPQIFGRIQNRTYTIEKVLLETLPGYYLGGNLYRPLNKPVPAGGFPAVVSPHGHWNYGRLEHTTIASVPARAINLAQQGYVVFAYDMVGYNDTIQTPHDFGSPAEELWDFGPFQLQLWNSIRAVDFLESLPDVNKQKIGATGASGGGTQTFSLAAIDDRIQFAAPVNMISAIMQGGGLCENAPSLRFDTFNVEIAAIFAPKPMIMVAATGDWTRNTMTEEYPAIHAIYNLYGKPENVDAFFQEAPHNYNQAGREAVYQFFGKHVLGEPDPDKFKEKSIRLEKLQDMLVLHNRTLPANALDYAGVFAAWKRMGQQAAATVTDPARKREMLELALGAEWPTHVIAENSALSREGRGDRVVLRPNAAGPVRVILPNGKTYAIDVFQRAAKPDTKMFLTFNRSDDANRVQDILTTLAWLNTPNVELACTGKSAVACVYAAAVSRQPVKLSATPSDATDFFVPGIERAGGLTAAQGIRK